jgi:hypothetical protein
MAEKLNNPKLPHWAATSTNREHSYTSRKALGQIWDYAESKIQAMVQPSDAGNLQANEHIIAIIEKAREKDASRVDALQEQMKAAVAKYSSGMTKLQHEQRLKKCSEEERKKRTMDWISKYCDEQRTELIHCQSDEVGKNLAAAVLYQATLENPTIFNGELLVR